MLSIYQQITNAIGPDGTLPPEFRVRTEGKDHRELVLDEGPCRNISAMEEGLAVMLACLPQVQWAQPDFSERDREAVQAILEAAGEDLFDVPVLRERAEQVLAGMA